MPSMESDAPDNGSLAQPSAFISGKMGFSWEPTQACQECLVEPWFQAMMFLVSYRGRGIDGVDS